MWSVSHVVAPALHIDLKQWQIEQNVDGKNKERISSALRLLFVQDISSDPLVIKKWMQLMQNHWGSPAGKIDVVPPHAEWLYESITMQHQVAKPQSMSKSKSWRWPWWNKATVWEWEEVQSDW